MNDENWSTGEKKAARRAFEVAYERECAALIAKLKEQTNRASDANDLWQIQEFLAAARKETDHKYDYRYSVLIWVFARLMREGWLTVADLSGLREDKIEEIKSLASQRKTTMTFRFASLFVCPNTSINRTLGHSRCAALPAGRLSLR